jgi:hypothetical protein
MTGGSNDTQESTTSTSLPAWQTHALRNVAKKASRAYNQGDFYSSDYFNNQDATADFTPEQSMGISNLFDKSSSLNDIYSGQGMNALTKTLGEFDPNDPSLQNAIQSNADNMYSAFARNVLPGIQGNAMNLGAVGSKRHGVAQGLALSDLSGQVGKMSTDMTFDAYKTHEGNQFAALNNLPGITSGLSSGAQQQFDTGGLEQDQSQSEIDSALQAWAYKNDVNINNLSALKALVSGDVGTSSRSTSTGAAGGMNPITGMLSSATGSYLGGL